MAIGLAMSFEDMSLEHIENENDTCELNISNIDAILFYGAARSASGLKHSSFPSQLPINTTLLPGFS